MVQRFMSPSSMKCMNRPKTGHLWAKKNKNNDLKDIKMLNRAEGNCRLCLKIQFKQLLCQVLSINPAVYETVCRQEQALVIKTDQSKYQSSYKCKWMRSLSERCMCHLPDVQRSRLSQSGLPAGHEHRLPERRAALLYFMSYLSDLTVRDYRISVIG